MSGRGSVLQGSKAGGMARWVARVRPLWQSTRAWAFVGALCTRGAGFIASFSLARFAGAEALALYVATVVTAAVVATPLAQVLFNGGTLVATAAPSAPWARRLVRGSVWMGLAWMPLLAALFAWLHGQAGGVAWGGASGAAGGVSWAWWLLAGLSSLAGQVFGFALTGLLNGLGAQLVAARQTAVQAALLMPLSLPCVYAFGLRGALGMLVLSALLPLVLQLWLARRWLAAHWQASPGELHDEAESPWGLLSAQVRAGVPNAIALVASGLGSWFCAIYLVQQAQGASAVAVLAVATQWTTLVLMPATSWGGVVLRELAQLRLRADAPQAWWPTVWRLMARNVAVTAGLGLAVLVAWHWIEQGYRMQGMGLATLMWVSVAAALVSSAHGVLERALITWQKQWQMMLFAFVGLLAQVGCTWAFVGDSLAAVQWGLMLSVTLAAGLSLWFLRRLVAPAEEGRA